jgi:hypothetical protein
MWKHWGGNTDRRQQESILNKICIILTLKDSNLLQKKNYDVEGKKL